VNHRFRFAWLWLAHVAALVSDAGLFAAALLRPAGGGPLTADGLACAAGLVLLPIVLLSPLAGAFANAVPKRWILAGTAAFRLGIAAVVLTLAADRPWLWQVLLVALGAAFALAGPARTALVPAAAEDGRLSYSLLNGLLALGGVLAVGTGVALAAVEPEHPRLLAWLVLACYALAALAALPAAFPSDVRRPMSGLPPVSGFFPAERILQTRETRKLLRAAAWFWAVAGGLAAVLVPPVFAWQTVEAAGGPLVLFAAGLAAGAVVTAFTPHPHRVLGWVPIAFLIGLGAVVWLALAEAPRTPYFVLGLAAALAAVPLETRYQITLWPAVRGYGAALLHGVRALMVGVLGGAFVLLRSEGLLSAEGQRWGLAGLVLGGVVLVCRSFLREVLELIGATVEYPFWRLRVVGPGVERVPLRGPLLVIANHAAWFDPLWLGKVFPRQVTPLMTARFYDLPVISWLMRKVVRAIRVPEQKFRHDAPELAEAVARLDEGECVLIFPEGYLRRSEDQLLRRFGQGVWRILHQRPQTPVIPCWIEGGWGSYFSYYNGPPTKNKPFDWKRTITFAFGEPEVVPPDILADHRKTREYLRNAVLALRQLVPGIAPAPAGPAPAEPDEEDDGER
jgi:1-acyl-sn-glycerol-3-phosphate acyltransferase